MRINSDYDPKSLEEGAILRSTQLNVVIFIAYLSVMVCGMLTLICIGMAAFWITVCHDYLGFAMLLVGLSLTWGFFALVQGTTDIVKEKSHEQT